MCGIYGEVSLSPDRPFGPYGDRATDLLRHRGPDARGTWAEDGVFLGSRRLSIIDVDGGSQPLWDDSGQLCIVYNGELYNFMQIRAVLQDKGVRFATRSDTEVVLHAYREWGPAALDRFNGMFAFAIWDCRDRSLFLARDRVGEKPLYYFKDDRRLIFASEIKAILADPSVPRNVAMSGAINFLTFGHSIAPQTMFEDIWKLPAGHFLKLRDGSIELEQYWDVQQTPTDGPIEDPAATVRELLEDSVRARLIADVPVGAFLSGGIDSSTVVGLMSRHTRVQTFSLGFTVGGAYDELPIARKVAQHFGTDHHELRVEDLDLVETLQRLVYHFDEPFGDSAAFPVLLLSEFAAQRVKVVLSGDGGDELFGGYRRYSADRFAPLYQRLPRGLIEGAVPATLARLPRVRRLKRSAQTLPIKDPARRYASWLTVFSPELQAELFTRSYGGHDVFGPYENTYRKLSGDAADHLNRLMYVDLKFLLGGGYLEKLDKAAMAASLETRLPLLDHRLVETAFRIPSAQKIHGLTMKYVLKEAVRDLVPDWVLSRPKHGFSVPTDPWFRGSLKDFAYDMLLDGRVRGRGFFEPAVIERLWKEHGEGRHVWDQQLWLLLNFEMWHRIYIDGDRPASVA